MLQRNPTLIAKHPELRDIAIAKRCSKYRNTKVFVYADGYISYGEQCIQKGKPIEIYDSIKEYERGCELKLFEKVGIISQLNRQRELIIQAKSIYNGQQLRKISYKADFVYVRNGNWVVEDVKPYDTRTGKHRLTKDFSLKWKLLKAKYPDYVFEIF